MDHAAFTPISSVVGGALIGLASVAVLVSHGRVAGISGICGRLLSPLPGDRAWRVAFLGGLVATSVALAWGYPEAFDRSALPSTPWLALAGALVGFGTRLGNGCTSGHGVCGISRLSRRSIVATGTFMLTAALTVLWMRGV
jgi:hypothetical protein